MKGHLQPQLAIMFITTIVPLVGTPALGEDWASTPVPFTNTGAEPNASGQAMLTDVVGGTDGTPNGSWALCYGFLTVTCQRLTPGAVYQIPTLTTTKGGYKWAPDYWVVSFVTFKAAKDGTGGYSDWVCFPSYYSNPGYHLEVARKQGNSGTAVLTGFIPEP